MHVEDVADRPIFMVKSGPAMAPLAGIAYAEAEGLGRDVLVVDAGGTTFDVSMVRDGAVKYTRETWLGGLFSGHNLGLSSVDVRSVGAAAGPSPGSIRAGCCVSGRRAPAPTRPRLLRQGRRCGNRDRRCRGARLHRPRRLPRRAHDAGRGCRPPCRRDVGGAAGQGGGGDRRGDPHPRQRDHDQSHRGDHGQRGGQSARKRARGGRRGGRPQHPADCCGAGLRPRAAAQDRRRAERLRRAVFRHRRRVQREPLRPHRPLGRGFGQRHPRRHRRRDGGIRRPPQGARHRALPQGPLRRCPLPQPAMGDRDRHAGRALQWCRRRGRADRALSRGARAGSTA